MKRIPAYLSVVLLLTVLAGCGATAKRIAAKSQSERADVFTEVAGTEPVPAGYADVLITAEIKTHREGYYKGGSGSCAHGRESYPYLFNVDGQAVLWKAAGKEHELPTDAVEGKASRDPEAGTGIKYVLSRKIRFRAGTHAFFFGLPEDNYYTEFVVTLSEGRLHVLDLKPHYWHKHSSTKKPTFLKGVNHYEIMLDGVAVRS